MTNTESPNNETSDDYSQLLSLFKLTSIGVLYQLSPLLLSEENQEALNELIGKARVELIDFLDKAQMENAVNQKIESWKNQKTNLKRTRVIVKVVNNTSHTLYLVKTSLPLSPSERESSTLFPHEQTALKCEFDYDRYYNSPSKILFNQFMDFAAQSVGIRFELGMFVRKSFGFITPTHTPTIKNTVISTGKNKIQCSSVITEANDDAPFNFEVKITLG